MKFPTRQVLLLVVMAVSAICIMTLAHTVPDKVSNLLVYLIAGCLLGSFVYQYRYVDLEEEEKWIEAQYGRAFVFGVTLTLALALFAFVWEIEELRAVTVAIGGAAAMYGMLREKQPLDIPSRPIQGLRNAPEPPPAYNPLGEVAVSKFNWDEIASSLTALGDRDRQSTLQSFRRIYAAAASGAEARCDSVRLQQVIWTVEQECQRLVQAARMSERARTEGDVLTKASDMVDWALQKTPEITEMNVSDLLMGKAIADIRRLKTDVNPIIVDLTELRAMHNVAGGRDTVVEKTKQRVSAARKAFPLIRSNGFILSEALIASNEELKSFESITGIQVVSLGPGGGYVTFEGNGRAWALKQAFSEDAGIKVEVQLYEFSPSSVQDDIVCAIQRVRLWKKVTDDWPACVGGEPSLLSL